MDLWQGRQSSFNFHLFCSDLAIPLPMVIEDLQQLPLDYLLIQRSMRRRERQAVTKDLTSSSKFSGSFVQTLQPLLQRYLLYKWRLSVNVSSKDCYLQLDHVSSKDNFIGDPLELTSSFPWQASQVRAFRNRPNSRLCLDS